MDFKDFKEYVQQLHPLVVNSNYYCLFVTPTDEYQGKEYFELPLEYIDKNYPSGIVWKTANELHFTTGPATFREDHINAAIWIMKTVPAIFAKKDSPEDMHQNAYFGYVTDAVKKEDLIEVYFKLLLMLPKQFLTADSSTFNIYNESLNHIQWSIRQAANFMGNFEKLAAELQNAEAAPK